MDYWREVGVPEDEFYMGDDRLVDPAGHGPRLWFQQVPEGKVVKNRLHLDRQISGGRDLPMATRRARVDAAVYQLVSGGAAVARVVEPERLDHYAVVMQDSEGNEFCLG